MKTPYTVIVFFAFMLGLVLGMQTCSFYGQSEKIIVHDTIPVQVPPMVIESPPLPAVVKWKTKTVLEEHITDSLKTIIVQRDSLRKLLMKENIKVQFSLDTITQQGDTVHVVCDEIYRTVQFGFFPALRYVPVQYETKIVEKKVSPSISIGFGGGYGMMLEGKLGGSVGIYAIWNIFSL